MKICLINPGKIHTGTPPLGLAYIAAYIRKYSKNKHEIIILDETVKDIENDILKFKPDIVGLTSPTPHIVDAHRVSKFIKEKLPGVPVLIGGSHVSSFPFDQENYDNFDIIVIGEGEVTFMELVNFFENGKLGDKGLHEIDGITFRENGNVVTTKPRELIEDMDSIPFPARDILDMDKNYLKPEDREAHLADGVKRATHMFTSRGCPYNCIFCSSNRIFGRKFRPHSVEYVIREMKHLIDEYKIDALYILDDTLIIDKERVRKLCHGIIDNNLKFVWSAQLRANLLKEEDIELLMFMKKAGYVQAEFGFESGSDRILKLLKAGTSSVEDNQRAIDLCRKAGLKILGNFMIGTVTETEEEIEMTKQFILKNKDKMDYISVHVTTPYPGTKMWDMAKERGVLKDVKWKEFWMGEFHGQGNFSDTVSTEKLFKYHKELRSISYDKMKKSVLLKTSMRRPGIFLKMLPSYMSLKIRQTFGKIPVKVKVSKK